MMLRIFYFLLLVALYTKDASVDERCCLCDKEDDITQIDNIEKYVIGKCAKEDDIQHIDNIEEYVIGKNVAQRKTLNGKPVIPIQSRDVNHKVFIDYHSKATDYENFLAFFEYYKKNREIKDFKNKNIGFLDSDYVVGDAGAVRRTMSMKSRDFLLANQKLFKCDKVGVKRYYVFVNGENDIEQEVYYEFLARLLSLCHHYSGCPLSLELNPLIYKVILNQCKITDDFFTKEDVQYYAYEYYNNWESLSDEAKKESLNEIKSEYSKILPQIKMFYNGICKFFNVDGFNLLSWFEKNEFLLLKETLEGSKDITHEIFEKALKWDYGACGIYKDDALRLKDFFLEIVRDFSLEDRKKLLIFITGTDSFGIGQHISIEFCDNIVKNGVRLPFKAKACSDTLFINVSWFREQADIKNVFKTCLENALLTADIFTTS